MNNLSKSFIDFSSAIADSLNTTMNVRYAELQSAATNPKNRTIKMRSKFGAVAKIETEDFVVQLTPTAVADTMELYWLESKKRGMGMGTEVLSAILDVVDSMGLKLELEPIPFKATANTKKDAMKNTQRLRNWYSDFDFKPKKFDNAKMIYKS